MELPDPRPQIHQIVYTWLAIPRASAFIRGHKLWLGLKEYQWVYRFLLLVASLAGLYLFFEILDYLDGHADAGLGNALFSQEGFLYRFGSETMESVTDGALKWVILILLEVVIYHFMRQTLKIIAKKDVSDAHSFKPFLAAQKRMIAVSFMAYGIELLITEVLSGVFFGIFGFLIFLQPALVFLVKCGLLGYAITDNYCEQFGLKISQSFRYLRLNYWGIALGLGIPLYLFLKVPFFGAFLGPILAAVTAAIVMHELSDLAKVGYQPSEKERKKLEKKMAKAARVKG